MSDTYFAHLQTLIGKPDRIEREKSRLDAAIREATLILKARLTPTSVPGLLWDLAMREFQRMGPQMGKPVTDFAGQTRFLRALCAAVPFNSITPSDHPKTDEILKICETLWSALFHREMLDDLKAPEASKTERHRFGMAALTSLLSVVQQDLIYVEQAGERVRRNFGPFSKDIIEPAIGLGVEDVLKGFEQVRTTLEERYNSAIENMQPARESYDKWCRRYDAGASAQELNAFKDAPEAAEAGRQLQSAFHSLERILLFTLQDLEPVLGGRSKAFLSAFSFEPGEVNTEIDSPTSEDVVRKRPFANLGGESYALLDIAYCSLAPLRRLLDCFDTDRKLQRLNKRRDDVLEDEAASFLPELSNRMCSFGTTMSNFPMADSPSATCFSSAVRAYS